MRLPQVEMHASTHGFDDRQGQLTAYGSFGEARKIDFSAHGEINPDDARFLRGDQAHDLRDDHGARRLAISLAQRCAFQEELYFLINGKF